MRLNGLVLGDRDTDNHEKKCHFPIILWAGGSMARFFDNSMTMSFILSEKVYFDRFRFRLKNNRNE
jgi:hypothetical protein